MNFSNGFLAATAKIIEEVNHAFINSKLSVQYKTDKSPITAIDLECHRKLVSLLQSHFPGIAIVSEEQSDTLNAKAQAESRYFCIDPIDGTSSLVRHDMSFAINIALIDNKIPVLGLIAIPLERKIYFTDLDNAYVVSTHDLSKICRIDTKFIAKREEILATKTLRICCSESDMGKKIFDNLIVRCNEAGYAISQITMDCAAVKFAILMNNEADLTTSLHEIYEWDVAAGDALLRKIGGVLYDVETGQPIEYGVKGKFIKKYGYLAFSNAKSASTFF